MTLYFDYRVRLEDVSSTTNAIEWHPQQQLLAVASYTIDRGGCVSICDDLGEILKDVPAVYISSCQALCLAWHPVRKTLVVGWETGQLNIWNGDKDFLSVASHHSTPILVLKWSKMGGRLISIDASGLMCGWRLDSRCQLVSIYQVTLPSIPCEAVFRITRPGPDLTGLARRAVAGDQAALDVFSAWRPRTAGRHVSVHQDNMTAYVATAQGVIIYVNETGKCEEVLQYNGRIEKLLYHDKDDGLVVVGISLNLSYYSAEPDGKLSEVTTVKLSGSGSAVVWAGSGVLACVVSDSTVRCWEPTTGETYALTAQLPDLTVQSITCLAYSAEKGLLCGCTTAGNVVLWHHTLGGWDPLPPARVQGVAKTCTWGGTYLAVNTSSATFIMKEHNLCAAYYNGISAVQVSACQLILKSSGESAELNTDLKVFGVCMSKESVGIWSSKTMAVYSLLPLTSINAIGSFSCEAESAVLYDQSLVVLTSSRLQVHTLQGTVKQSLDSDGQPICLTLTNNYLTVATINGIIHLWDMSRREAKVHGRAKDLVDCISDFGEVICARSNASGTKVALSVAGANLLPSPKIYVWDMESDTMLSHTFGGRETEVTRFVVNHYWDCEESRLLVCETKRPTTLSHTSSVLRKVVNQQPNSVLVSLIASSEHGLLSQDTRTMTQEFVSLLAVDTPNYIVLNKPSSQQNISVEKILMRDFEGLENCDAATKSAVIKFSFSLIIGDIDHAFKSIHNIHSVAVWSSLARMCVKARRLDVAKVCLGNMKDPRGVMALRQASSLAEHDAQVAALAVHLGMLEEAEQLYASCGRWDLLNKLLQARGKWGDAIKLAEERDRIHLRHTCHWYGKHLESQGDNNKAGEMYKRADTHRQQVPRMMLHDYTALQEYIANSDDPALVKWWAQYMESTGDMEAAMRHYTEAGDYLSMVRVMCFLEDYDRAEQIANSSGDRAACYHLARQYENMGQIPEAIHFFTRATAYANAIRICKEQGLEEQLWVVALSAGPQEQLEGARYLAESSPDKAVLLYHRAGMLHRALHLAFKHELVDAVQQIASELSADSDTELLVMCANFFIENQHFENAIRLLAIAKQYKDAISLCLEHSVGLTEELAELVSPAVGHSDRAQLLDQLAECALAQANYHLATKKYTQAGQKVKAIKALLKSGDTEKIIFFATVSRQQEIYVMAANYLQTLDWQAKPELLKNIITFYTKGKAPHLLANFYMACAQVEIDEYGNYEKALGALNEASRCITKEAGRYSQVAETANNKIALVKRFLDIRRMFERGEGGSAMTQCELLLGAPSDLVRRGDIFSLLIEQATQAGDWQRASKLVQQLQASQPHDNIALYVPKEILERLGISNRMQENDEERGQEIEEEVEEVVVTMT